MTTSTESVSGPPKGSSAATCLLQDARGLSEYRKSKLLALFQQMDKVRLRPRLRCLSLKVRARSQRQPSTSLSPTTPRESESEILL